MISSLAAKFIAFNAVGVSISWLVIHAATGSRTMARCTHLISLLMVCVALLRNSCNFDLDGRFMPRTTKDAVHFHCAPPLFFALANSVLLIAHAAALHAATQLPPATQTRSHLLCCPSLASSLKAAMKAALPAQHVIPVLFGAVAIIAMSWQ